MKKTLSILVLLCVLFTMFAGFGVLATEEQTLVNFLTNGSFEELDAEGKPLKWNLSSGTKFGEFAEISSTTADGKNSLRLMGTTGGSSGKMAFQMISGLTEGKEYTFSADICINSITGDRGASLDVYFRDAKGYEIYVNGTNVTRTYATKADKKWHTLEVPVVAPTGAVTAQLVVRSYDGADVYFDNVKFMGEIVPQTCTVMPIPEGSENLFTNGDFEELDVTGQPVGWTIRATNKVKVIQDGEKGNVLHFNTMDSSNPWASQTLTNLQPGATYQISADLKTLYYPQRGTNMGPSFKVEGYSEGIAQPTYDVYAYDFLPTFDTWQKVAMQFVLPESVNKVVIYARLYSAGEFYYDNIELHKVAEIPFANIDAPHVNYTEWKQGSVSLEYNYDIVPGMTYDIKILDGKKAILSDTVAVEKEMEYKYDLSLLEKYGEEYTITVDCKDAGGNVIQNYTSDIYRFDRPKNITEGGLMIDGNGEEFAPVIAYHVLYEDLGKAADSYGINVVRSGDNKDLTLRAGGHPTRRESTKKWLDEAWYKHGIMTMLTLYDTPLGNVDYFNNALSCIEELDDHPGLLGYLIVDEPYNDWRKEVVYGQLKEAYLKLRRATDKPVATVANRQQYWETQLDWSDFNILDRYPTARFESLQYNYVNNAKHMTDNTKPVWDIAEVAYADNDTWEKTGEKLRNMIYQMYFARGEGVGYFGFSDISKHLSPIEQYETQNIAALGLAEEYKDAAKAFLTGEYPTFNEYGYEGKLDHWADYYYHDLKDNYYYKMYVKDNELYIIILNHRTYDVEVEIPLISYNGKITLGDFRADLVSAGSISPAAVTGNGVFKTTVAANDAPLYKITSGNVDYSSLTTSNYYDLIDYGWARDSINTVKAAGIVNDMGLRKYAPEKNITRADFAGYLIRTLGLTGDDSDTFADVDDSYTYAKEIAIGKALGILNGVGDNKYNPDAPISRQDLMVICTRGMKLVKEMNLDTKSLNEFSDAALIASYAREGITGMVTEGIVKGNTDGTINPLGFATRAEAAVIMDRILNWK